MEPEPLEPPETMKRVAAPSARPRVEPARPRTPVYPPHPAGRPEGVLHGGSYQARFARDEQDVERIQRLRFEVFNRELGEGLAASWNNGLDVDPFDAHCHHLLVVHVESGAVVGTYRVQTWEMARAAIGFYSDGEFDLSELPEELLRRSVETGRACVDKDHRNGRVITLLWKGLASYIVHNRKSLIFGCCSLTSQDPHVARQTFEFLERGGFVHPQYHAAPRPGFVCYPPDFVPDVNVGVKLPALFAAYLKLGSRIAGEPAIDREFKTIDFLALLDCDALEPNVRATFFRHLDEPAAPVTGG